MKGNEKDTGSVLSVRFTAEELDKLRNQAERAGVAVSAYVRRGALDRGNATSHIIRSKSSNAVTHTQSTSGITAARVFGPSIKIS